MTVPKKKVDKETIEIVRRWLNNDPPRVGTHEIIRLRESQLKTLTTEEAIRLGAELQRNMTARIFDIHVHLCYELVEGISQIK